MGKTLDSRRGFGVKLAAVGAVGIASAAFGDDRFAQIDEVDQFQQSIGKRFTVSSEQHTLVVELREVNRTRLQNDLSRPSSLPRRHAVSLIFSPVKLRQKPEPVYQLEHRMFGRTSITLMPVGPSHDLEAVLN
jgi:hypothetical protein